MGHRFSGHAAGRVIRAWACAVPVAALFLLFFSPSTSPLFIFEGFDSAMFKTMGRLILRGGTPYADLFDNKGPLLYLINAVGLWLGGRWGLWALQVAGLSAALACVWRTVRLVAGRVGSAVAVGLMLVVGVVFWEEGNQCEEWAMYLFAVGLCVAARLQGGGGKPLFSALGCAALGLLFGLALLVRPNDAVGCLGGLAAGLAAWWAWQGQWRRVWRLAALFAAGAAVAVVPFVLWFAARGALADLWYGVVGINVQYVGGGSLLGSLCFRAKMALGLLLVVGLLALSATGQRRLLWLAVPVAALELTLMGGHLYFHYHLMLLPLLALMFAAATAAPWRTGVAVWAVLLLCPQTYEMRPPLRMARKVAVQRVQAALRPADRQAEAAMYASSSALFAAIPPDERDSVWALNFGQYPNSLLYQVLVHSNIVQCNRIMWDYVANNGIAMRNYQPFPTDEARLPLWVAIVHYPDNPMAGDSAFMARYSCCGYCDDHYAGHNEYVGHGNGFSLWRRVEKGAAGGEESMANGATADATE